MTRLSMFKRFTSMKHAVLFATDIAARGLDFPSVDWVLQVDAPEDAETYIHRVGRTARYESAGKGLLLLVPSEEEGMVAALKKKNVEVQKIKIKASKTQSVSNSLQNLAFQDPEIKYLGQRVRLLIRSRLSSHAHRKLRRSCRICDLYTCIRTSRSSSSMNSLSSASPRPLGSLVCRRSSSSARRWRRRKRTRRGQSQTPDPPLLFGTKRMRATMRRLGRLKRKAPTKRRKRQLRRPRMRASASSL